MCKFYRPFFFLPLILALYSLVSPTWALHNKNLWPLWTVHNLLSAKVIPHQEWQEFLNRRLITNEEGINLIDYAHLNAEDMDLLTRYIEKMTKVQINTYNRNEQLAFWLNLYNAVTVYTIARYYPVSSIADISISPGLFSTGPWGAKLIRVNDIPLSLDEIQNRIIRPIWNDPRCNYALNNGSIGAANLSKEAYQGKNIENQLNEAAYAYINSLRGAQVIEGKLVLSSLYEWFIEDFGDNKEQILAHVKLFAKNPLKSQLKHINTIDSYVYNWHLNGTFKDS